MKYFNYYLKRIILGTILALGTLALGFSWDGIRSASCETPTRLVIIRGKVTQLDHPTLGTTEAIGTLVFQKVGCDACYIGANINTQGRYEISVGDGKYKVMYMDPIDDRDYLAPDQPKFIDTQTLESKQYSQRVFYFDVKLKTSPPYKSSGD